MAGQKIYRVTSEQQMLTLGAYLAANLMANDLVFLSGDLGMGKTTLVRGILHALGHTGRVKSPSYTLVEPYCLVTPTLKNVFHFDLYRLANPRELLEIGFEDYLSEEALLLLEWPEKADDLLPMPSLHCEITLDDHYTRRVMLKTQLARGEQLLDSLPQSLL